MAKLALRHCTPIKKGTKPISAMIARSLIKQLSPSWSFSGNTQGLEQEFSFKNFHETIGFVNAVAWIANTEDHHPDLKVSYNRCKITFTTHAAGGLTVNDFICAAKIDAIYKSAPEVTAEKTQAIVEPRAETGALPRPSLQSPELNMSEVEELLNIEIKAPDPEPSTVNEEDELQLTDPDDEPTLPHLHNPPTGSAAVAKSVPELDAVDNSPEPVVEDEAAATDQDGRAEGHFLTTVILPPGMQRAQDKEDEATVIAQPDLDLDGHDNSDGESIQLFPMEDSDEDKTMMMPVMQEQNDDAEEEPDMMKTMIIKPPLFDEDEALNSGIDDDETLVINPPPPGKHKPR